MAIVIASTREDAEERANKYQELDPFPSVPMGLLSSAEIHDYARVTSLVHPFYEQGLKSASYEAHIGGECIYWNPSGEKQRKLIKRGEDLTLRANSITFVQAEPEFRLPEERDARSRLSILDVGEALFTAEMRVCVTKHHRRACTHKPTANADLEAPLNVRFWV